MYFKFNQMIGRMVPSPMTEAYIPQGFVPEARPSPVVIFDSKTTKLPTDDKFYRELPKVDVEPANAAFGVVPANPGYRKIMQMQKLFLKDDGKLVWQKLGSSDRMMYYATLGVVVVGSLVCLRQLYRMSFPPSSEE